MKYTTAQIIKDTRVALGLNEEAPAALILDDEQLTIDQRIRACIIDAVTEAHLQAPLHWLTNASAFSATIAWNGDQPNGSITLPSDFLRLVAFRMSDWLQPVAEPILITDPAYALQLSPYPGVRGTPERPVCALVPGGTMEFYSCSSQAATISQSLYMPIPSVSYNSIDIAPLCYNLVINNIKQKVG